MGIRRFTIAILLFIAGDALAAEKDSLRKIERLASIEFHRIINQYRASMNVEKLGWDDTLWMASHNHNLWMQANDNLNHHEKAGTTGFTGYDPGDRYAHVAKGDAHRSWSGENCLYNYSYDGTSATRIAKHMAEYAFNQWKNSEGHNRNMLAPHSRVHGVAFLIDDNRVWATDLFARGGGSYRAVPKDEASMPVSDPIVIKPPAKAEPAKTVAAAPKKKQVKIDIKATEQNLQAALTEQSAAGGGSTRSPKALQKAALKHAEYLAAYRKSDHKQAKNKKLYYAATPAARVRKASKGLSIFGGGKNSITESVAVVSVEAEQLDVNQLAADIMAEWAKDGNAGNGKAGIGIKIKRIKNTLTVYAVRVARVK